MISGNPDKTEALSKVTTEIMKERMALTLEAVGALAIAGALVLLESSSIVWMSAALGVGLVAAVSSVNWRKAEMALAQEYLNKPGV